MIIVVALLLILALCVGVAGFAVAGGHGCRLGLHDWCGVDADGAWCSHCKKQHRWDTRRRRRYGKF